jgi:lipopolysaccharide transport system ATP-binding protein
MLSDPRGSYSVKVEIVSKQYRLNAYQEGIRSALASSIKRLIDGKNRSDRQENVLWALKDVSFTVPRGESLGIMGPNGAGKTTALKILSRVTEPTSGKVRVRGRLAAIIELSAGFHPDLTGRENIYLNGTILGMKRAEIRSRFDSIVEFSDLAKFIDTPVKRYSSGMYVRLAFSIAAHTNPDVMLIDEVLAVGDAEFRQKCIQKINELRSNGVSILFISHNLFQVRAVCNSGLFLLHGQVQAAGHVDEAIAAYENWMRNRRIAANEQSLSVDQRMDNDLMTVRMDSVEVFSASGEARSKFICSEPVEIRAYFTASQSYDALTFDLRLTRSDNTVCCLIRSKDLGASSGEVSGSGYFSIRIKELLLTTGTYFIDFRLRDASDAVTIQQIQSSFFKVLGAASIGDVASAVFLPPIESIETIQAVESIG